MTIEIELPDSAPLAASTISELRLFLQACANRLVVGELRYGKPDRRKHYRARIGKELTAYHKGANFEQLLNIANYAFLESLLPETGKLIFDPYVESVTRESK